MTDGLIFEKKLKMEFKALSLMCNLQMYVLFLVLLFGILQSSHGQLVDSDPYRHTEILDGEGKYQLDWMVDWRDSRVIFNVTVRTAGYIGFGLSLSGKGMAGADIVIGGVNPDGKPYFSDRHADSNKLPIEDEQQDWTLHAAWETHTHTFLSFSRPFDTCDEKHDVVIPEDRISILWAFGEKDNEIEFHHQNRGLMDAYLLDPDLTPRELRSHFKTRTPTPPMGDMKVWSISGVFQIPPKDTTYICTIHKAPSTEGKQHIIGFNPILPTELDRKHIHHYLLHRCNLPEGQDAYSTFQRHVGSRGEECYVLNMPTGRIPTQYCREVVHVFAVGGNAVFFPETVGLPLSESPHEYYLLQMHYDNPEQLSGLEVRYTLEIFYSDVRKHDAGIITIGGMTPGSPSIMVPPHSLDYKIYGHCGSGCTNKILPEDGIRVWAVNLHTHLAGRGIRLIHIRDNKEMKWLLSENSYNFNFQQNRILKEERTILPGDTLINRCIYENTDRNGSVTVGGFSTRNEMCNGFIWYYNKLPNNAICRSEIRHDIYRSFLDIWNTTWSDTRIENIVNTPSHNAGLAVSEVGNHRIDWTSSTRKELQSYHRFLPQITQCPVLVETPRYPRFPFLELYNPPRRSPPTQSTNAVLASFEKEIVDPDTEFVSIYPSDIVPYEIPSQCQKK